MLDRKMLSVVVLCVVAITSTARAADVQIQIDDGKPIHKVSPLFSGTNFVALWNNTGDSERTVKAFSSMGLKVVRFPGGAPSSWYDWQAPLWTTLTPDIAWNLAKAGGAKMMFQTCIVDNVKKDPVTGIKTKFDNSPEHVADWVKYCKKQGIDAPLWEIGNEPEMDLPKEIKGNNDRIYKYYNARYEEQAKAIRDVFPKAMILGPAATNEYQWWHDHNLERFMAAEGNRGGTGLADVISLHWYPGTDNQPWEKVRGAAQHWEQAMTYIRGTIQKFDTRDLPLFITEWNWAGGMGSKDNGALRAALGNADIIGMFLRTGVAGQTHFCLQGINGWGVLGMKNERVGEAGPTPAYFALAMTSNLGTEVLGVKNSADEKNVVSAYACRNEAGDIAVLLINKTGEAAPASIAFSHYSPAGKAVAVNTLEGATADPKEKEVVYNGVKSPKPETDALPPAKVEKGTANYAHELPPYSVTVLHFAR